MKSLLVLSIKPEYMKLILTGEKSIELRKCKPSISDEGAVIALYCTYPVKAIVGFCLLSELIEDEPCSFWNKFSKFLGVNKETYKNYYTNSNRAIGLRLNSIYKLKREMPLNEIKKELPDFYPPQTYKYYKLDFLINKLKIILDEKEVKSIEKIAN